MNWTFIFQLKNETQSLTAIEKISEKSASSSKIEQMIFQQALSKQFRYRINKRKREKDEIKAKSNWINDILAIDIIQ